MDWRDVSSEPLPKLRLRPADSHKGHYGRVLVIGGSTGKAGAAALAGIAALRSGAGLVTVAVPGAVQHLVASFEPSYMTLSLCEGDFLQHSAEDDAKRTASSADCVAVGPGLGTESSTCRLVHGLFHSLTRPMVVDADALNALAASPDRLQTPGGIRILTPHPGEFERLTGHRPTTDPGQRIEQAVELSRQDPSGQTITVLKGHRTVMTDGQRVAVNSTGNPGMATGGCGDVLTGILTALVGQGLAAWDAVRLGVHVHGLAGDLAAQNTGQVSLIASDLLEFLPQAFRACLG